MMKHRLIVLAATLLIILAGGQTAYASPAPPDQPGRSVPACPAEKPSDDSTPKDPSRQTTRTVEGTVRMVALDPARCGAHDQRLVLVSGTKSYELKGARAAQARPNTRMQVSGLVSGNELTVNEATTVAAAPGSLPTTGTSRILIMLATWTQPDTVTTASARAQIFDEDHRWYQEASYQQLGLSGDVTPWMTITGPANGECFNDREGIMSRAKTAATDRGFTLGNYDNFILYFPENSAVPGDDCAGTAGFAYVGAPNTWLNGYMDLRVTVHELGHNYGLQHANSYFCSNADLAATCSFSEYGDPYDAMGDGFDHVGHFNAYEKNKLDWFIGRTPPADLTAGGSRTLIPLESSAAGVAGIKVTASPQRVYWLEYRQPVGFDAGLPAQATTGALVHIVDPSVRDISEETSMVDAYPNTGTQSAFLQIRSGASWRSPEGFVFSVGSLSSAGAAVTVTPRDTVAPVLVARTPSPNQTAVAAGSDVRATFSEPVTGVPTSFTLRYADTGAAVAGAVGRVGTTDEWSFNPNVDLDPSTRYTAALGTGIRDLAGQAFVAQQWSFTTVAAPPAAVGYRALTPARLLDTRTGNGAPKQIVAAGGRVDLVVLGRGGVPNGGVASVVVNLTVTGSTRGGHATVYPTGVAQPPASTLNYPTNRSVANGVIVKVGTGGKISIATSAPAHLIVDVQGYFQTGADLVGLTPTRLLDTRSGQGAPVGIVKPAAPVQLQVLGVGGVPSSGVTAVILNVTATGGTTRGLVTVHPAGGVKPGTATVAYNGAQAVATGTVAKVGTDGKIALAVSADVHLVVDVQGYLTSDADLAALTPARVFDTRTNPGTSGWAGHEPAARGRHARPGRSAEQRGRGRRAERDRRSRAQHRRAHGLPRRLDQTAHVDSELPAVDAHVELHDRQAGTRRHRRLRAHRTDAPHGRCRRVGTYAELTVPAAADRRAALTARLVSRTLCRDWGSVTSATEANEPS